jgi:tryptophan-rich hypothetical protein
VNKITPNKLLNSKWSAVKPINKDKHFIVTEVEYDEREAVTACSLEAVMSGRVVLINWYDLKDDNSWAHGWR